MNDKMKTQVTENKPLNNLAHQGQVPMSEKVSKTDNKPSEHKKVENHEHKVEEKMEHKKEEKKTEPKVVKEKAFVRGLNLPISVKHSMYICTFIKGKGIDESIALLEKVMKKQIPVPMKGEVPHKRNMLSGRYPIKASEEFIRMLKGLRANALQNGIINPIITEGISNLASRPFRRFGSQRFKRSHVYLEVRGKPEVKK